MQMFAITVLSLCGVVFLFCIANIIRLGFWSKFLESEIDQTFQERVSGNKDAQYPNIRASYNNFKAYEPFNYRFKSMIVYDTAR